jgi:hypothetical protein
MPVKLAFTADLHLPMTTARRISEMAGAVAAFEPEALVVAGDVGENLADFARCLNLLKEHVACPIWVLPGNHDLWARGNQSRKLFEELLPETTRQLDCHWLEGASFKLSGVGVAGTIAWYDYSAADAGVRATAADFASNKKYYNADANMIDWRWTDVEFAGHVATPFLAALDALEADPEVRRIIVATHVPLVECQMCRDSGNPDWAFSNAYFGNLTLGHSVLARSKVTHIVSGHTHVERHGQATREAGPPIDARVLASDYGEPAWVGLELE